MRMLDSLNLGLVALLLDVASQHLYWRETMTGQATGNLR